MSGAIERIAESIAASVAAELTAASKKGTTEADFRREAARVLDEAAKKAGLDITPRDEYSVASGRVDSLYNKLIIEYKAPGRLKDTNEGRTNQEVISQTQGYILNVAKKQRKEEHRLAGVISDGRYFIFIRRFGESWAVDEPEPVNASSTEKFLRLLFALSTGAALVPENLIEDFGPKTLRAWRAVGALYQALHKHTSREKGNPLVGKLFEQWSVFFGEATDYKEWSARIEAKKEFRDFVAGMKLDPKYVEAPKVFFALHTYYALLIKLVASLAAARFAGSEDTTPFSEFMGKEGNELKDAFAQLEHGGLFRQYGIRNFLEGDFFGWYISAWDTNIEQAVGKLILRLSEYDPGTLELAPENARDLLKNLYHSLLPKEIRHDLGEYYTPDWLAEHVIRQTLGDADLGDAAKRVLDPSCGSGTFLVLLIKFVKERAERKKQGPEKTLELILQNIVGFDLNPLAVIAARTNYLLALGDLLKYRQGDIDIPVYQADSVLTPSKGTTLFNGTVYPMETSVGEFRVPAVFASRERLDILANELDQAVEDGITPESFLSRLANNASVALEPEELKATWGELLNLYTRLKELHDHGLNGVWARIIKNAFAPLFIEPCHYVVGNPPWVNWNNLPDRYRDRTKGLWQDYMLFPKFEGALKTILGSASYDISMLFTYVAVDKYLRKGGKLGFVVSESLFKSTSAGTGFRRFVLPDKTALGVCYADDLVDIQPFEGASNRTAALVLAKGKATIYPVDYVVWKRTKTTRMRRVPFDAQYDEVVSHLTTRTVKQAEPVIAEDPTSSWMTVPPKHGGIVTKLRGSSKYIARIGVHPSINGVFWLHEHGKRPGNLVIAKNAPEHSKTKIPALQAAVERELVYPLLRGADVSRWTAATSMSILVTHLPGEKLKAIPEQTMQREFPKAWSYLTRFQSPLRKSGIYRRYFKESDPFYSVFNIGDYTFSEWKLVIREIASGLTCAVVGPEDGKPVVADHKLVLVAVESKHEAHYLCAILNSAPARFFVESYCVSTQFSTHIFENLSLPKYSSKEKSHKELAELSIAAHQAVAEDRSDQLSEIERDINQRSALLWGLSTQELQLVLDATTEARG